MARSDLDSDILLDFAGLLNQQNDFDEIIRLVSQQAGVLLGAQISLVMMLNPRTRDTVKTIFQAGAANTNYSSLQQQVSGWILNNSEGFLSPDIRIDVRFQDPEIAGFGIQSVVGVPLRTEGVVLGSLILLNKPGAPVFGKNDMVFLDKLALLSSPYLRNAKQIQQFFEVPIPEQALLTKYEKTGLLGRSQKFVEMLHSIEAAARCDVRVMLEGESGTGKELIAGAIHRFSQRNNGPFVAIDCGAIPDNLMESELFGYEKGAFTGATKARVGLIEEASGGTLFIDEVANLALQMQAKLMRVLQQNEIRPLGSNRTKSVDVRIISASSRSCRDLVARELFREDLFYRLYVYPIFIPPLRGRGEDIGLLAGHFMTKSAAKQNKPLENFHEMVLDYMKQFPWPGNIRELENFVERLVTLSPVAATTLQPDVIPPDLMPDFQAFLAETNISAKANSLTTQLMECERKIIVDALKDTDWHQAKAARKLRMSEQNFRYRLKKLCIKRP